MPASEAIRSGFTVGRSDVKGTLKELAYNKC